MKKKRIPDRDIQDFERYRDYWQEPVLPICAASSGIERTFTQIVQEKEQNAVEKQFFSNRVVDDWNRLPQHVVDSENVDMFKRRLDKNLQDMGV